VSSATGPDATDQYDLPVGTLIEPERKSPRILCLTGGGYRGLFTARILARLEEVFCDGQPLGTRIDFFAGTSVGGLLALGLACGRSASYMRDLLNEHGPAIFPSLRFKGWRKLFNKRVYDSAPLELVIRKCLEKPGHDKRLCDIDAPVLLTTVSWSLGELRLLRSAGLSRRQPDKFTLLQAARATSAAPSFFPAQNVDDDWFIDGGLAANAPDIHALAEARVQWGDDAVLRMLSVGTAGVKGGSEPSKIPLRGIAWAEPALNLVMSAQEHVAESECARQLGNNYLRLNRTPSADQGVLKQLDSATKSSKGLLTALADSVVDEWLNDSARKARLRNFFK
jgi:hypothetical protein